MRLEVFNLRSIQTLAPAEPWSVISIVGAGIERPSLPASKWLHGRLDLSFEDTSGDGDQPGFSGLEADRILDFHAAERPWIKLMAIHCVLGLSRSPAVAAALAAIQGEPVQSWLRNGMLNRHVYRTLLARAQARRLWSPPSCIAAA